MGKIQSFRDLLVWKEAHDLVLMIYKSAKQFPKEEEFVLKAQLLRAAISIPTNIAEGKGRNTIKEYIRFLDIVNGSLEETKYLLLLAHDLNYIDHKNYESLESTMDKIGKMLFKLRQALNTAQKTQNRIP